MSILELIRHGIASFKPSNFHPTPEPPLSPEEHAKAKLRKAIEVIEAHKVCENAAYLINEFHAPHFGAINYSYKKGSEVAAKDLGQKEWLKVYSFVRYEFGGSMIDLVTLNMHNWVGGHNEPLFGTFLLRFNGCTVLETSCSEKEIDMGGTRGFTLHVTAESLAAFKAGAWMDCLAYLVSESKKNRALQQISSKQRALEELKARADKIDLG